MLPTCLLGDSVFLQTSASLDRKDKNNSACGSLDSSEGDSKEFGFSISDGLYERGVFVSAVRPGGPAAGPGGLKIYDKILQVFLWIQHAIETSYCYDTGMNIQQIIIIVYRPSSMLRTGWTLSPNQAPQLVL